jgi:hypothetical protein
LAIKFAEIFPRCHARTARLAYVGDQARRKGYQDRDLLREINLTLDVTQAVPDGILVDTVEKVVIVAEFITTGGAITASRKEDLERKLQPAAKLGYRIRYMNVFPDRKTFARFAAELAYSTESWIAAEGDHVIRFNS